MAGTPIEALFSSGQDPQQGMTQRFMPGGGMQPQPQMPTSMHPNGGMMMPGPQQGQQPGGGMGANSGMQMLLGSLLGAIRPGQPQLGGQPEQPQPGQPQLGGQPQPPGGGMMPPPPQIHSPGRGLFGMFPNPGAANRDAIANYNNQLGYQNYQNEYSRYQQELAKQREFDTANAAAGQAAAGYGAETGDANATETATHAVIRSLKQYSPGIEKSPAALLTATKLLEPLIGKDVTERLKTAAESQKEQHQDEHQDKQFAHSDEAAAARSEHSDEAAAARSEHSDKLADERAARSETAATARTEHSDKLTGQREETGRQRDELKAIDSDFTAQPGDKAQQRFHVQVAGMSADNEELASIRDRLSENPKDPAALTGLTKLTRQWKSQIGIVLNSELARLTDPNDINALKQEAKKTQDAIDGIVNGMKAGTITPSNGQPQAPADAQPQAPPTGEQPQGEAAQTQPQQSDIDYLKEHPMMARHFDLEFGEGASRRALGQ